MQCGNASVIKCKWRHQVTKFGTNASGGIRQPSCSLIGNSNYRSNAWVRCASGNVFFFNFTDIPVDLRHLRHRWHFGTFDHRRIECEDRVIILLFRRIQIFLVVLTSSSMRLQSRAGVEPEASADRTTQISFSLPGNQTKIYKRKSPFK